MPEEELQVLFNEMLLLNHPDGHARLSRELFGSLDEKLSAYKLRYPQLLYIHLLLLGVDKNDICTVLGYKVGSVGRIRGRLARRFGLKVPASWMRSCCRWPMRWSRKNNHPQAFLKPFLPLFAECAVFSFCGDV